MVNFMVCEFCLNKAVILNIQPKKEEILIICLVSGIIIAIIELS